MLRFPSTNRPTANGVSLYLSTRNAAILSLFFTQHSLVRSQRLMSNSNTIFLYGRAMLYASASANILLIIYVMMNYLLCVQQCCLLAAMCVLLLLILADFAAAG